MRCINHILDLIIVAVAGLEMTRPEPVLTIGMPSFVYDKNAFGDKLKITTTVTPFQGNEICCTSYT